MVAENIRNPHYKKKLAKVSWELHYAKMSSIYGTVPYTVRKIIPVKRNMEVKCMNLHRVHETPNYKKVIAKVSVRWIRNRVPIRYPHYEKIIAKVSWEVHYATMSSTHGTVPSLNIDSSLPCFFYFWKSSR